MNMALVSLLGAGLGIGSYILTSFLFDRFWHALGRVDDRRE